MRDLNYQLKQLCHRNNDGSYATRVNREQQLKGIADQLHELGYRRMTTSSLKPKHVEALVKHWLAQELSAGTIKNRMSCLRWWAEKVNKRNVIARANDAYGIPNRQFISDTSKAKGLSNIQLERVKDAHVRMSLQLQLAFGLRREEAIKIQPRWSDRDNCLQLKPSWTKGGRARTVPIRTEEQRELLERAKALAGKESLVPRHRSYIQQVRLYERQTANAGLSRMHGLRYAYPQRRYEELTGWRSAHAGGPPVRALTPEQRRKDHWARITISKELGHEREQITAVYLGR